VFALIVKSCCPPEVDPEIGVTDSQPAEDAAAANESGDPPVLVTATVSNVVITSSRTNELG